MREIKFRAKVIDEILWQTTQLKLDNYTDENIKEGGIVEGWLCYTDDGKPYILGDLIEANEEYTINEFWYPVDEDSIELIEVE